MKFNDNRYFVLPSLDNPKEKLYGISCFRQISRMVYGCPLLYTTSNSSG